MLLLAVNIHTVLFLPPQSSFTLKQWCLPMDSSRLMLHQVPHIGEPNGSNKVMNQVHIAIFFFFFKSKRLFWIKQNY